MIILCSLHLHFKLSFSKCFLQLLLELVGKTKVDPQGGAEPYRMIIRWNSSIWLQTRLSSLVLLSVPHYRAMGCDLPQRRIINTNAAMNAVMRQTERR